MASNWITTLNILLFLVIMVVSLSIPKSNEEVDMAYQLVGDGEEEKSLFPIQSIDITKLNINLSHLS